jgi:hypothetical protein
MTGAGALAGPKGNTMAQDTTWAARVAEEPPIDIRPVPAGRTGMKPGLPMLYPSPHMINAAIRAIPEGETVTVKELKVRLAEHHDVVYVCPVTATNSLRVVAEAVNEAIEGGTPIAEVTPVWRAMEAKAPAWRKLSFDPTYLQAKREG